MRTNQYDPDITPGDLKIDRRQRPMPPRSELMKRCSFPHPDNNRHIDAFIKAAQH